MTVVLDVLCAMGVVGAALVTGMADVAHEGSWGAVWRDGRPGVGRRPREGRAPLPAPVIRAPGLCPRGRGRGDGA
ncbi:hypothetical protein [Streptomyces noursei]|uniref:hypothetical protein n=1 Tax=Streptomyces noursei TaxID=1971 RepID=UPI0011AFC404|nr:hypothetical protein [Streptomyces noursei]